MKKIILFLIMGVILSNCGYTAIFSSGNSNFYMEEISLNKNDKINRSVEKNLKIFSNEQSINKIKILIGTEKITTVITKDKKGNPSRYEMKITTTLRLTHNGNQKNEKQFVASFNYKDNSNKFDLKQYENEIENLLISKIIEDCLSYFSESISDY